MSLRKVTLPAIGPIRWRRDGFGTQVLSFPKGGQEIEVLDKYFQLYPPDPIQRGYVKIWRKTPGGAQVVDRALTVKAAHLRIQKIKQRALFPLAART